MLLFLVPGYLQLTMRHAAGKRDGLDLIRQVWLSFTAAEILIGAVVVLVASGVEQTSATPWVLFLLVAAGALLAAEGWVLAKPLRCDSLAELASSYRTRFFLAVAFAEAIALLAFVASIMTGRWWLYWLLLPVSLAGLTRAAPTPTRLLATQDDLRNVGCNLSLVRALRESPTSA